MKGPHTGTLLDCSKCGKVPWDSNALPPNCPKCGAVLEYQVPCPKCGKEYLLRADAEPTCSHCGYTISYFGPHRFFLGLMVFFVSVFAVLVFLFFKFQIGNWFGCGH